MTSKESGEPRLQIHQIVLLIAAMAGGVWFYEGPLKSSRPVAHDIENRNAVTSGEDRVQARLWQDPFEAVETHLKSEESKNSGRSSPSETAHSHSLNLVATEVATSTPAPDIQILVILTDGSPHADNRESRLRQRFAVLAGMDRTGLAPRDGEYIRFFYWDKTDTCQSASAEHRYEASIKVWLSRVSKVISSQVPSMRSSHCPRTPAEYWRQAPVPVEWYQSLHSRSSHVLILWIKDQDLGVTPVESLRTIQRMTLESFPSAHKPVSFKIIGPRFSGTLQAMIAESEKNKKEDGQSSLNIYSPWSTTPEGILTKGISTDGKQSLKQWLEDKSSIIFTRMIPTDDELMATLADELERRGVSVGDGCVKDNTCGDIAVIAEWDTFYGRTLPLTFSAVAIDRRAATNSKQLQKTLDELKTNPDKAKFIHRYSYLRGLDGELPQTKLNTTSGSSSDEKASFSPSPKDRLQDIERMERPEGRSQLDYTRRLTQLLREKDDDLRAECGQWKLTCSGFKAIGVLGSDVYDKMLILQSLKESFPHVIFFTTDLDARLFHPSELAWTRNLVVASHFDLTLNKKHLQGPIPPFRDTYQTATLFTVLRALDVLKELPSGHTGTILRFQPAGVVQGDFEPAPRVKLHEIGRNGPVDISINSHVGNQAQALQQINTVRAAPANLDDAIKNALYATVCLLIAVGLLIPASASLSGWVFQPLLPSSSVNRNAIATGLVLGLLLLDLLFGGIIYLTLDSYEGEPFSLLDGVSIWPSQMLRGTVIGLALLFGLLLIWNSRLACDDMEKQFPELLKSQTLPSNPPSSLIDSLKQWWKAPKAQMFTGMWALDKEGKAPDPLWEEYRKRLDLTWILMRVAPMSVLFVIVGTITLVITGLPFTPFRGHVAELVNLWLLCLAVLGMIVVIFLVLDITQLTSVFVRKLVPKETGTVSPQPALPHLQLIEQLTDRIDDFIWYPAVLLVLMLVARSEFIDNWDFPIGLMVVVGLSASYVVVSAIQLRQASECARQRVIDALSVQRRSKYPSDSAEEIQQTIKEVKALSKGAFMPITELPVFRAVTLPTGFYALLTLVETFIKN